MHTASDSHRSAPIEKNDAKRSNKRKRFNAKETNGEATELHSKGGGHGEKARWRTLFNFTTKQHASTLLLALTLSLASGIVVPIQAVFLGRIFLAFTSFGATSLDQSEFRDEVVKYCVYLCALGAASWLVDGLYFTSWLAFGELQGQSARLKLFSDMLEKDMAWFDLRKNGIGALLPRLQM